MKADNYLNHFILPNFYFHITAAYAILLPPLHRERVTRRL
jgi:hypothetical protein